MTNKIEKWTLAILLLSGCSSPQSNRTVTITPQPASAPVIEKSPVIATLKENTPVAEAKATDQALVEQSIKPDIVCSLAPDMRTLRIENDQPKGCSLFYSKFGKEERIAWSVIARQYCETVRDRVRSNLENANFSCK